ncbi:MULTISPECIES: hypothetical protein [Mycobacterium]|uniref:hypothetical protein n=1 Tax=Mycobacterium TaxID=1763 RepID=UPI001CD9550E|nr:hypothetical protein [Mycobacterium sp. WUMAC-067]MCA2317533.1 hypothetical protein [Mycobacterium sp. WUMAC-025]
MAQGYEAKRPWPGHEIQRKPHLFFEVGRERQAEGNPDVAAMDQDIGEKATGLTTGGLKRQLG